MKNEIRETIERWKIKAEIFLNNNIKAFIVDIYDSWYSCDIIFVGDVFLVIRNFDGEDIGKEKKLYWTDVMRFEEWKGKEEVKE